jgi:hypothetical protein
MIFPRPTHERTIEVQAVISQCLTSVEERRGFYNQCATLFLHGSPAGGSCKSNKVKPIIRRQSSFLYAPDSVRFWVTVPPDDLQDGAYEQSESVGEAVDESWSDTGLDLLFGETLTWALVYGCMIVSILPQADTEGKAQFVADAVYPYNFGVYREDQPDLLKQEAVCLVTYLSMPEIERLYEPTGKLDQIKKNLSESTTATGGDSNIWFSGVDSSGNVSGVAPNFYRGRWAYNPRSGVPLYKIYELYAYDDHLRDYRLFTVVGNIIVRDLPIGSVGIPGRLPFVKICPDPLLNYFWGQSPTEDLQGLQQWYTVRLEQMDRLWEKLLKPPKVIYNAGGMQEEKVLGLNEPGGVFPIQNPQAKVEEFKPDLPDAAFTMLAHIEQQFTEESGMRPSMFGKQEPGVRTEGMAAGLLRVSAAEIRRVALTVERQIEDAANLILRYKRRYDDDSLIDDKGQLFLVADFPASAKVKVDGHSACPLFVEDHAALAQGLMRAGAIDQETLIELMHPPLMGRMKHKLKRIQFAKLVAQATVQAQQQAKRTGKGSVG